MPQSIPQRQTPVLRQPVKKVAGNTMYDGAVAAISQTIGRRTTKQSKDGSDAFLGKAGSPLAGEPLIVVSTTKQGSVLIGIAQSAVDANDTLRDLPWGRPYKLAGFDNQPSFLPIAEIAAGAHPDMGRIQQAIEKVMDTLIGPDDENLLDAILAL